MGLSLHPKLVMSKPKSISIAGLTVLFAINMGCVKHTASHSADILYSDSYSASNISIAHAVPQSGKVLTLDEAIKTALSNNPNIQIGELKALAASAQYYGSLSAYTPDVTASKGAITGKIAAWNGLANQMDTLAAKAQYLSAREMSMNTRRLYVQQLALVYNTILLDKARIKIQKDNVSFYQEQLRKLQSKPNPGALAISDALQFKTNIDLAQSAVIKSIENFNNDKCALAVLMGLTTAQLPSDIIFPEIEIPAEPQKDLSVDQYLDMAIGQRPDLQASRYDLNSAKYNLYSSYGQLSPTIDATVQLNKNPPTGINAAENLNPTPAIANIQSSQDLKDSAEEKVTSSYTQALGEVRTSYNQLNANAGIEKILEDQYDLGLQSRDLVAQEYEKGKVSISELIQTQNELISTEKQLMKSKANINIYRAQLDAAAGINQH